MLSSLASRPLSAFPVLTAGRLPHCPFRGLLSVHFALRPACSLNRPQAILLHRSASVQFVTSLHRSDCFRLERQLPGGIRTRWDTAPFHGARRVEERRASVEGEGSSCCRRLSHEAGASVFTIATFPLPAHRTGRAGFPHPALGRDHAFAHGKLAVRCARRARPMSFHRRLSGNRTYFPARTLCLRHSHWRSRLIACASTAL